MSKLDQTTSETAEPVIGQAGVGMDPELKAKWVEALRSGEYHQTRGMLQRDGRHCCLGVLCVVSGLIIDGAYGNRVMTDDGDAGYEPIYTLIGERETANELFLMNDGINGRRQHTFAEIASYIEANIPTRTALAGAR